MSNSTKDLACVPTEELRARVALSLRAAERIEERVPHLARKLRQDALCFEEEIKRRRAAGKGGERWT